MIKYLLAIAAFVGITSSTQAQTHVKLGHINTTQLLGMMPETKNADSLLQRFQGSLESQLKTMTSEYQNKISDFKSKEGSMAEPVRDAKVKEIGDLEERIQDFQESAQSSMQKKKEELYSPVIKKAEEAINNVAKEKAYSYIFDTSVGAVLFAIDSDDIMPLVKQKLGLK
jgi:outer membrane protein